jgi:hypothetical protein
MKGIIALLVLGNSLNLDLYQFWATVAVMIYKFEREKNYIISDYMVWQVATTK